MVLTCLAAVKLSYFCLHLSERMPVVSVLVGEQKSFGR